MKALILCGCFMASERTLYDIVPEEDPGTDIKLSYEPLLTFFRVGCSSPIVVRINGKEAMRRSPPFLR